MAAQVELDDGEVLHRTNPRTFSIPRGEVRRHLPVGTCQAQLVFVLPERHEDGCRAERMWCLVTERRGDRYLGELVNRPAYLTRLAQGAEIEFEARHVISVSFKDEPRMAPMVGCSLGVLRGGAWPAWLLRAAPECPADSGWRVFAEDDHDLRLRAVSASALARSWAPLDSVLYEPTDGAWWWDGAELEFVARTSLPPHLHAAAATRLGRLPAAPPPFTQRAVVTLRALEETKPSYAQRLAPARGHADDSGWAFSAGTEPQAYIDDRKNLKIVPIARLIHLFPYVERVIGEVGERSWQWEEDAGDWVEVR